MLRVARPVVALVSVLVVAVALADKPRHEFNGPYTGACLNRVAFPIGGIGSGMFCLEGTGAISHMSVRHQMEFFHEPAAFAAICVLGEKPAQNVARVVEGPIPDWKYFGRPGTGNGGGGTTYGFPRFRECEFAARFPFATVKLSDPALPLEAEIVGWSPFTPPDADASSLPAGALEYRFRNRSDRAQRAIFSFNTRNFMGKGSIGAIDGGFVLYASTAADRDRAGAFAAFVDGDAAVVDHCWFRGGWFDPLTIVWDKVARGTPIDNPPAAGEGPGASLAVKLELAPGAEKTIRLLSCWYVPNTRIKVGGRGAGGGGPAFHGTPSRGTARRGQQPVSGYLGRGLVNTFDNEGDDATGRLTSPEFAVGKRYLHFLVGGGNTAGQTCVNLLVDGKVVATATGNGTENLDWTTFDLQKFAGRQAKIELVDEHTGGWGHILADHFVLSDEPLVALKIGQDNAITNEPRRVQLLQDFEGDNYGQWVTEHRAAAAPTCSCADGKCCAPEVPSTYVPWYARQFRDVGEVAARWRKDYADLRQRSELFRDTFYDSSLPAEVLEAVAANLTILKTPTVLRQHDGRLWCWEGCGDSSGCCAGSCTHVWNYAQAISHLFPSLERSLRQTEFFESQDQAGRQAFRANLPISPGGVAFDASDGQLGGIMKAYREWRTLGEREWLAAFWPRVKQSLDYAIGKFDPRHTGLLEESHHNTYDINYFGPDGHCGSFYLGALAAGIEMGTAMGDDVALYRELLAKGRKRMESELFNGEYFIQLVMSRGWIPISRPCGSTTRARRTGRWPNRSTSRARGTNTARAACRMACSDCGWPRCAGSTGRWSIRPKCEATCWPCTSTT
jgi:hypothetical protein